MGCHWPRPWREWAGQGCARKGWRSCRRVCLLRPTASPRLDRMASAASAPSVAETALPDELLLGLLESVVRERDPEAAAALRDAGVGLASRATARALQAQGLWFQLLSLGEQYAAFRLRREAESGQGRRGSNSRHVPSRVPRRARAGDTHRSSRECDRRAPRHARDHGASDRSETRDRAREIPCDLPHIRGARRAAGDAARARGAHCETPHRHSICYG